MKTLGVQLSTESLLCRYDSGVDPQYNGVGQQGVGGRDTCLQSQKPEREAGGSGAQGLSLLHSEFEASLGYMKACPKKESQST